MDFEKEFKNKMKLELGVLHLQAHSNTEFLIEAGNAATFHTIYIRRRIVLLIRNFLVVSKK